MPRILDDLRAAIGSVHVLTDADLIAGQTVDWTGRVRGRALAVVRPGATEEVAEVVRICRLHQRALVPQGGNTGLVGGSVPRGDEVIVDLRRLDAITDVDADAGQLTAGAGATVADVQAAARQAGWRYGVDFASRDSATIGGSIATNAGGLRVIRHGSTRRQVLGVEAVLGTGDVVRRLHGLVKDNTGYDLAGLLCGSEGTLGIVTRARLALVPAAGETVTALVGCDSMETAVAIVGNVRRSVPTIEAAEVVLADGARLVEDQLGVAPVLSRTAPVLLLVEAVGPPDPADALQGALDTGGVTEVAVATDAARSARLWEVRERHTEAIAQLGAPIKFDVTLPLGKLAHFAATIPSEVAVAAPGARTWLFGHVADGNLHVNVTGIDPADAATAAAVAEVVLAEVIGLGGSISAEHGIGTLKQPWLERDRGASDVAVMRAIKRALDPDGICNPGVLLTGW